MNVVPASRLLLGFGFALTVAACDWPQAGTGGMGERQHSQSPAIEQASETLDRLSGSGGEQFAAADMVEARLILTRTRREFAGGMTAAAEGDLARLKSTIERIEGRLKMSATVFVSPTAPVPVVQATAGVVSPVVTIFAAKPPSAPMAPGAPVPLIR